MCSYLSIDVDYWRNYDIDKASKEMDRFFQRIVNLKVPIYVVKDHEELLKDVNTYQFDTLINMDFHSDITSYIDHKDGIYEFHQLSNSYVRGDLNCGTWVNFVENRKNSEFLWIYPQEDCFQEEGRCEDIKDFWDTPNSDYHNWAQITCQKGWSEYIRWSKVRAVGIAISPFFLFDELEEYFLFEIYPRLGGCSTSESFEINRLKVLNNMTF